MADNLTNVAENKLLDHVNLVTAWTPATPLKVRLYTAAPTETGGGTEVTGGSYAATNVTFGAAASGSASNSADVVFPTATASWGTVVAAAVVDSAGTPVMIWYGNLTASKVVDTGDTFKIPAGSLTVALS
jgi:hypothetical protein